MFLKNYIKEYPNLFPLNTLSTLIKVVNKLPFEKAKIGSGGIINEKIRKVSNYGLTKLNKSLTEVHWANLLNRLITDHMNQYLKDNDLTGYVSSIKEINQCDVLKYEKNNYYTFHVDGGNSFQRTLSAILFLNNDYVGGDLCFEDNLTKEKFKIKPKPGSLIIWPSNFLFPHCVEPVQEGVRYSIVAWA